jgi:3-oxoacyl-[acyl-carrier-protein] synthase II
VPELPRVLVTGIGVVSPLGPRASFWERLQRGETAIARAERIETGSEPPHLVAAVAEWNPRDHLAAAAIRRMDRLSQMVVTACRCALEDAALSLTPTAAETTGIVMGTAFGDISETETFLRGLIKKGPSLVNPMTFPNLVFNSMTGYVSIDLGLRGPNHVVCRGDASGEAALMLAYDLIVTGQADVVLAGGADELAQVLFEIQRDQRLLSPLARDAERAGAERPREWASPFDRRRNGFVMGEGAAVLVLERAEHAEARRARAYAEFAGHVSYRVPATPHVWPRSDATRGPARDDPARLQLLDGQRHDVAASSAAAGTDLVVSSANSTPERDAFEASQLVAVLNETPDVIVTSIKGSIGEFGAAGALSAAAAVLALATGALPRLGALEEPDPGITLRLATMAIEDPRAGFRRTVVTSTPRGGGYLALLFLRP